MTNSPVTGEPAVRLQPHTSRVLSGTSHRRQQHGECDGNAEGGIEIIGGTEADVSANVSTIGVQLTKPTWRASRPAPGCTAPLPEAASKPRPPVKSQTTIERRVAGTVAFQPANAKKPCSIKKVDRTLSPPLHCNIRKIFVFRCSPADCFWAGQALEASVIRSEIRSRAELNCDLPLFLHPSQQRDTAHRPIGTGRLRVRRRFGYWGEQIGHLRDQSGHHFGARRQNSNRRMAEDHGCR
jgi:hypothetical protein